MDDPIPKEEGDESGTFVAIANVDKLKETPNMESVAEARKRLEIEHESTIL